MELDFSGVEVGRQVMHAMVEFMFGAGKGGIFWWKRKLVEIQAAWARGAKKADLIPLLTWWDHIVEAAYKWYVADLEQAEWDKQQAEAAEEIAAYPPAADAPAAAEPAADDPAALGDEPAAEPTDILKLGLKKDDEEEKVHEETLADGLRKIDVLRRGCVEGRGFPGVDNMLKAQQNLMHKMWRAQATLKKGSGPGNLEKFGEDYIALQSQIVRPGALMPWRQGDLQKYPLWRHVHLATLESDEGVDLAAKNAENMAWSDYSGDYWSKSPVDSAKE